MTIKKHLINRHAFLVLLLLVFATNMALYHTSFGITILGDNPGGVVLGSIFDLAIVMPVLFILWKKKRTIKSIFIAVAFGLILTRFLIPMDYLAPYESITWFGFAIEGIILLVEGSILLVEIYLLIMMLKYLPATIQHVKKSSLPLLFSFHDFLNKHIAKKPIIKIICTELLMFYYALASWKKKAASSRTTFSLHKKSSMIAVYLMLIHSILIETIVIHWWLYEKAPIISIVLLILNIYSILFFIGHLQAIRLNPIQITDGKIYLTFGLLKRMKISVHQIDQIIEDPILIRRSPPKETIEFIARDLEAVEANLLLVLKQPEKADLFMGFEKKYQHIAIRADEVKRLKEYILKEKEGVPYFE